MPVHQSRTIAAVTALIVTIGLTGAVADVRQGAREQEPLRVGGDIPTPEKTRDVRPVYPPAALADGIQGVVIIEVTVGTTGQVTDARVLRGHPALDQPALDAVRQWEYTPTVVAGRLVAVRMTVTVNFGLQSGGLENFARPGATARGLPLSPAFDLTGIWIGDDGGTYQVRTVRDEIYWFGTDTAESWGQIFHGNLRSASEYTGRWADVPPGDRRGAGLLTIRVLSEDEFVTVTSTAGSSARRWRRWGQVLN